MESCFNTGCKRSPLYYVCMICFTTFLVLSFGTLDLLIAQAAGAPAELGAGERIIKVLPMFIIVFFIFYFLIVRPQNKQQAARASLLGSLKKGDQIITLSGILGKFSGVEGDFFLIDVGNNVKLKIENAQIGRKLEVNSANKGAK